MNPGSSHLVRASALVAVAAFTFACVAQTSSTGTPVEGSAPAVESPTTGSGGGMRLSDVRVAEPVAEERADDADRSGIRSLQGTRWIAAGENAQFSELVFTEAFMTFGTVGGGVVMVPADYSAQHPACLGYPSCVMTVDGSNLPAPFFLGTTDGVLFFAECRAQGQPGPDGAPLELASLREGLGSTILFETERTLCWNPGRVPYVPATL
jgi:hypothetical protein